jgi:hypothetical protein
MLRGRTNLIKNLPNELHNEIRLFHVNSMPAFFSDHMPALRERFCQIFVALFPDRKGFLK